MQDGAVQLKSEELALRIIGLYRYQITRDKDKEYVISK